MTFKTKLHEICNEVASEFPNWSFGSGAFNSKALKHTTLTIDPGFHFANGSTPIQPAIVLLHKKSMALFKRLLGYNQPTSIVQFQIIPQLLEYTPQNLRRGGWIFENKSLQMKLAPPSELAAPKMVDISEAKPLLRATLLDGLQLIERLYDLSSEEHFLRALPPQYQTFSDTIPYDEFVRSKGVMLCMARVLVGESGWVEYYRSDNYKTVFPKRTAELDKIVGALSELEKSALEIKDKKVK
jgi:hypothetical protein